MFKYVDPDDGLAYEMNYVVTQSDAEGREYVEYRLDPSQAGSSEMDTSWHRLPGWAMPPEEAIEHWHGSVSTYEPVDGVIVAMRDNDDDHRDALCLDMFGDPFWADLAAFTNVSHPDGDEVAPGHRIRAHARYAHDLHSIHKWLLK